MTFIDRIVAVVFLIAIALILFAPAEAKTTDMHPSPYPKVTVKEDPAPPEEPIMSLQYLRVAEARLVNTMTYKALMDKIIFFCTGAGQIDLDIDLDGFAETRMLCEVFTRESANE